MAVVKLNSGAELVISDVHVDTKFVFVVCIDHVFPDFA